MLQVEVDFPHSTEQSVCCNGYTNPYAFSTEELLTLETRLFTLLTICSSLHSVAVIVTRTKRHLNTGLTRHSRSPPGREVKAGTKVEAMEEHCSLASSP